MRRRRCAHTSGFAVVSGTRDGDELAMTEPAIVCRGCGALRRPISWYPDNWSEPLGDVSGFSNGFALLVHATNISTREEADRVTRQAWERWVDVGGPSRRMSFGRPRAEDFA